MEYSELIAKNKLLEDQVQKLQDELNATKEHLKKYTSPTRNKKYYETHREELLEKMKANPVSSEKRKEYNKKYYLKKTENSINV
jgi:hypothetical protein